MALTWKSILSAWIVGFIAWGYGVHLLPALRYVGYAFVAGALSTLLVLAYVVSTTVQSGSVSRKSPGAVQSAAFLSSENWKKETEAFMARRIYSPSLLYSKSFVISEALNELLNLALRDFVSSWYGAISPSPAFANEVDRGIRAALEEIRNRLLKQDLVDIAVSRMVPIITTHLKLCDQAERAVRGRSLSRNVTESDELNLAIAGKYKPGKLHPAASLACADLKLVQQDYLRKILVRLLPEILPENMIKSRAVLVLIKEMVACAVLYPVMQMLADPDTLNQLVEAYGRTALQDRKTVRRLRAALDEHASPAPKSKSASSFPRLDPNDTERAFERFVRAIRHCNNLSEARRFRSQVASQLKRESMLEGQDQTYLRRLESGKRVLDQKVAKLSMTGSITSASIAQPNFRNSSPTKQHEPTLVELMHSSTGLSYFMEYMDRQRLMPLVQFWVVVDGFRNPLEDDFGDDATADSTTWSATDREDIAQITEAYLSRPELRVHEESRAKVRMFLEAGKKASFEQYRQARTAILAAQSATLEEMQSRHFLKFKKSDLYYKYLTSDEAAIRSLASVGTHHSSSSNASHTLTQFPPMVRATSQPIQKAKDLRRAAASSGDIRAMSRPVDDLQPSRRSLDADHSVPLFDDEYDTDPLANSTYSVERESQNGETNGPQDDPGKVIETMGAALNDIITNEPTDGRPYEETLEDARSSLFGSPTLSLRSGRGTDSPRDSLDFPRIDSVGGDKSRPSIASLGLVNMSGRIGVFSDDDLFPDEDKFIEDEYADPEDFEDKGAPDVVIHEAAPGDLGLAEAIAALTADIDRLHTQESIVDTLTRKAELTNNVAELRILGKSKASLQRETRRKELQRQQYMVQESENGLFGRSTVRIKSIMVGKEEDGREYAIYLIEVQRSAGEQMPAASWAVARRYSEFHNLNQRLRMGFPSTRNLEFPRRRVVMKLQKDFLSRRRSALEKYLRQLLLVPEVCRSLEFRAFLSQRAITPTTSNATGEVDAHDIVSRIYNSVTDGMDDFLGNVAVLDQLSTAGQNLISAATTQFGTFQSEANPDDPVTTAEAEAELNAFENRELEPFVKPICDIFLEIFELNKGNNWLRGRAVIVVLHQLLGGTIERKVRENARSFVQEESVLRYITLIKHTMWPGGKLKEGKIRTSSEKTASRNEASVMLATLIPDLAANVVGRANAQNAARRIFATMNNSRLNTHLVFTLLDEFMLVLFGDGRGR